MDRQLFLWCGVDVSKKTFDVALVTNQSVSELRNVPVKRFESTETGIGKFVSWVEDYCQTHQIPEDMRRVVMESTGSYSFRLAKLMVAQCTYLEPAIINPAHAAYFQKSLGYQSKTDPIDARALGVYGRERKPAPYDFPSAMMLELRDLFRLRSDLVGERVANQNRIAECDSKMAIRHLKKHVVNLKKRIKDIEADMKKIIEKDEEIAASAVLLRSIPGVGFLTSACILAELGDLNRFKTARQLTAFVGLSPKLRDSGTSVKGRTRLSRSGSPIVRKTMYMAALAAIRNKRSCFRAFFEQLVEKGKHKKSAVLAVERKMLVVMRSIIKNKSPYSFPDQAVENLN